VPLVRSRRGPELLWGRVQLGGRQPALVPGHLEEPCAVADMAATSWLDGVQPVHCGAHRGGAVP
jgi:hypothetical protein